MFIRSRKRLASSLFAIMLICAGLGTLIAYMCNPKDPFNSNNGKYSINIDDTKLADATGIEQISVKILSADLNIIPEDRVDVKAVLSGYIKSSNEVMKPELIIDKSSNKLSINMKSQNTYWGYVNMGLKMYIYIPKAYTKGLSLQTSSGDINLASEMKLSDLSCSLSSGDLTIKNVTCDKFSYKCSSGSLQANTLNTKETVLDSSSGDMNINSFTGDVSGESSSGEISINYTSFNNNVTLQAHSGDIKLKLPEISEFYIDANCSSGDVECDFPVTISGKKKDNTLTGTVKNDKNKLKLNTSSGDIFVKN